MDDLTKQLTHDREMFATLFWKALELEEVEVDTITKTEINKSIDEWFSPRKLVELMTQKRFLERFDNIYTDIDGFTANPERGGLSKVGKEILAALQKHQSAFNEYQVISDKETRGGIQFGHRS